MCTSPYDARALTLELSDLERFTRVTQLAGCFEWPTPDELASDPTHIGIREMQEG